MSRASFDYSVLVVGGGPAGALASLDLARAGARVLVVDRSREPRTEAAELLAPEGRRVLEDAGVWSLVPPDLISPCSKMAAAWASAEPVWTSFAGQAAGYGWHIDRIRFDRWLLDLLRYSGVDVVEGTAERVETGAGGWRTGIRTAGSRETVSSHLLILATGRSAHRLHIGRRTRIDNLGLLAGVADSDPVDPDALIVEAAADGWWYSAPLVDGRLFTGWMTDFSLVPHAQYGETAVLSLARTTVHARRVSHLRFSSAIGSAAWELTPAAGPGWIAIGDAALARDPIGGDGLTAALTSARHGAEVVTRALQGDDSVWAEAAAQAVAIAGNYRRRRLDLYRLAGERWPGAPFWERFARR